MNCLNCKYKNGGQCFRYPPVLIIDSHDVYAKERRPQAPDVGGCGEFKEKESDTGQEPTE